MSAGRPCEPRVCWGNAASHGQCVHACGSLCFDAGCRCQGVVDPSVVHCAFVLQLQMLGYPIGFVAFPVIEVMTQVSEGTVQTNYWGRFSVGAVIFCTVFASGTAALTNHLAPVFARCPPPGAILVQAHRVHVRGTVLHAQNGRHRAVHAAVQEGGHPLSPSPLLGLVLL